MDLNPSQEVLSPFSNHASKPVLTKVGSFFPPKGNHCKLFDSPSPGSSTTRSVLKRPERSQEESPPGSTKRRKSMAWASPEDAASPEKPQEVSFADSFLLQESETVFLFYNFHWVLFLYQDLLSVFHLFQVCL